MCALEQELQRQAQEEYGSKQSKQCSKERPAWCGRLTNKALEETDAVGESKTLSDGRRQPGGHVLQPPHGGGSQYNCSRHLHCFSVEVLSTFMVHNARSAAGPRHAGAALHLHSEALRTTGGVTRSCREKKNKHMRVKRWSM